MNSNLLRHLRREAERITIGKPRRKLVLETYGRYANYGTLRNDPRSTRGAYRVLKAIARKRK